MNNNVALNQRQQRPLRLTYEQKTVLGILKRQEIEKYPISQWYLGVLYALNNEYNPDRISQAAQSLREVIEKLPKIINKIDEQKTIDKVIFINKRNEINEAFRKNKEKYGYNLSIWKENTIDGRLVDTLKKVDEYLELNKQPNRKEKIQTAITRIDPMFHSFGSQIRKEKTDQFYELWKKLEEFTHHQINLDIEIFNRYLQVFEQIIIDLLAPITAEDQRKIKAILKLDHSNRSKTDEKTMLSLIRRRGANYAFFFENATDASWLPILKRKDFFKKPIGIEKIEGGDISTPFWWPMQYLKNVSTKAPQEVIEVIQGLPETDNPKVYRSIIDIALILSVTYSIKLKSKIHESLECLNITTYLISHNYLKLLIYWIKENQIESALELLKTLLKLKPDSEAQEKEKYRKKILKEKEPEGDILIPELEPKSNFNQWDYSEILDKGIERLAEIKPYEVACILIKLINQAISFTYKDEIKNGRDYSYIWCQKLNIASSDSPTQKEHLILTLTSVCKKVYEKTPDLIENLDNLLRKPNRNVFQRIRQHLYSLYPNEQTKTWICEEILNYKDYHQFKYDYELQKMITHSVKCFGKNLLSQDELIKIFDKILIGPSKENFKKQCERNSKEFTENDFKKRQVFFHRLQLRAFEPVLFGKYLKIFKELETQSTEPISNENYLPFRSYFGKVSSHSPKSSKDLAKFTDEELLDYINKWEDESKCFDNNEFVEVSIKGLVEAFGTVFKEYINKDSKRLNFWVKNCHRIQRAIYIKAMLEGRQIKLGTKDYVNQINQWFDFCEWVLSHNDQRQERNLYDDELKENPSWQSSRRSVADFVTGCISTMSKININKEQIIRRILEILKILCTQFDKRLDQSQPTISLWEIDQDEILKNPNDYLQEAVNSTRSRALEQLIQLGYYLRKEKKKTSLEILSFLEERFRTNAKYPFTLQEYAILGFCYGGIYNIDKEWAIKQKSIIFPQVEWQKFLVAFGNFLSGHSPHTEFLRIFQNDFIFTLNNLNQFKKQKTNDRDLIDVLGQHLWLYYLGGKYPLKNSLLEKFYEKADKKHWKKLFELIGRQLKDHSNEFDKNMKKRAIEFFDWRLKAQEPTELQEFSLWLEAKCLDAKWRLDQYSKILDTCQKQESIDIWWPIKTLHTMLTNHTKQVMVCFEKLTCHILSGELWGIPVEDTKAILEVGLKNKDEEIFSNAKQALDHLLKAGCFEFLDMEDKNKL